MPKHPSTTTDPSIFAKNVMDKLLAKYDPESVSHDSVAVLDSASNEKAAEPRKNPAAVALGKLGGSKGGTARAASLSPKKRSQIAKKAAKARWSKGATKR